MLRTIRGNIFGFARRDRAVRNSRQHRTERLRRIISLDNRRQVKRDGAVFAGRNAALDAREPAVDIPEENAGGVRDD
jgi:hypothetical protein